LFWDWPGGELVLSLGQGFLFGCVRYGGGRDVHPSGESRSHLFAFYLLRDCSVRVCLLRPRGRHNRDNCRSGDEEDGADLGHMQQAQNQATDQLRALQSASNSIAALPTLSSLTLQRSQTNVQANSAAVAAERERERTRQAVRQAEQQRDAINAKQQRIDQLQTSIDWNDHMAQDARSRGSDPSIFEKQSEQLLREKRELQR
jgi:hypothetical protein